MSSVTANTDGRHRRLIEAATLLLSGAGGSLPITSLMKGLFYLDLVSLRDLGETATLEPYLALKAGPVVASYERRVVRALEYAGLAQQDVSEDGGSKPVCLICLPTIAALTEAHQRAAKKIAAWAASKTPSVLSEFSHHNVGWQLAWDAGLGAQRPAQNINMRIAMQQVIDDDPWLDASPRGDVATAFLEADISESVPW